MTPGPWRGCRQGGHARPHRAHLPPLPRHRVHPPARAVGPARQDPARQHPLLDRYAADPKSAISWRFKGPSGSGALADVGSHASYLAEFLAGPATECERRTFQHRHRTAPQAPRRRLRPRRHGRIRRVRHRRQRRLRDFLARLRKRRRRNHRGLARRRGPRERPADRGLRRARRGEVQSDPSRRDRAVPHRGRPAQSRATAAFRWATRTPIWPVACRSTSRVSASGRTRASSSRLAPSSKRSPGSTSPSPSPATRASTRASTTWNFWPRWPSPSDSAALSRL